MEITSDLPRRRKGIVSLENLSPSMLSGAGNRYNQEISRFPNRRPRIGALKRPTGADLDAGHDPVIQIGRVGSARAKSKERWVVPAGNRDLVVVSGQSIHRASILGVETL